MPFMKVQQKIQEIEGFGPKNIALIAGIAVFLLVLAFSQGPVKHYSVTDIPKPPQPNEYAALNKPVTSDQSSAVLGASTLDSQLETKFSSIPVTTTSDNSEAAIQNYKDQVSIVLQSDGIQGKTLDDLQKISVPSDYAQYHRMLIVYYGVLIAQNSGAQTGISPSDLNTLMSYLQGQLSSVGLVKG